MPYPLTPHAQHQWIEFRNETGETIPAYGVVALAGTGLRDDHREFYQIALKPGYQLGNSNVMFVNSGGAIRDGEFGVASNGMIPMPVAHSDSVSPAYGETWGVHGDGFALSHRTGNFRVLSGNSPGNTVLCIREATNSIRGTLKTPILSANPVNLITGTFTLSLNGHTTSALAALADSATIQSALEALPSIGAGNVVVTDNAADGRQSRLPLLITFQGTFANQHLLLAYDNTNMVDGCVEITTRVNPGRPQRDAVIRISVQRGKSGGFWIVANPIREAADPHFEPIRISSNATADEIATLFSQFPWTAADVTGIYGPLPDSSVDIIFSAAPDPRSVEFISDEFVLASAFSASDTSFDLVDASTWVNYEDGGIATVVIDQEQFRIIHSGNSNNFPVFGIPSSRDAPADHGQGTPVVISGGETVTGNEIGYTDRLQNFGAVQAQSYYLNFSAREFAVVEIDYWDPALDAWTPTGATVVAHDAFLSARDMPVGTPVWCELEQWGLRYVVISAGGGCG